MQAVYPVPQQEPERHRPEVDPERPQPQPQEAVGLAEALLVEAAEPAVGEGSPEECPWVALGPVQAQEPEPVQRPGQRDEQIEAASAE